MRVTDKSEVQVGMYLFWKGEPQKIVQIYDPPISSFGLPLFCAVLTAKNGIQKLSFQTISEYEIFDINKNPEVFL